jgi:PPOX class probable F420-dependent enzyme
MSETRLPRDWVERRLALSTTYWVVTVCADGRPHATPVWGVWQDDAVWFGTGDDSVKGRNLRARPGCVVHLESGDDVVILEGEAERVADFAPGAMPPDAERAVRALAAKYAMPAETMAGAGSSAGLYRLRPREVRAWLEPLFVESRVRWEPWVAVAG